MSRKWFILCCLLLIIPGLSVHARDVLTDEDTCFIEESQVVDGTVFALCEELIIDGRVNGDIFGAAVHILINGSVNGNLYLVGGQMDIYGDISKDIHYAGAVLRFNPAIDTENANSDNPLPLNSNDEETVLATRSIKALTLSTTLYDNTMIDDGLINAGYQLIINGDIDDEVNFWGSTFIVNGTINGNVFAIVGDPESDSSQIETLLLLLPLELDLQLINPGLILGSTGEINGLLSYRGPVEGVINGTLSTEPNYVPPDVVQLTLDEPGFITGYLEATGSDFSTLLIIGILILFFASRFLQAPVANLRTRPFASLGVGLLGFLLSFPIVLIFIILSLSLLGFLFIIGFRGVVLAIAVVLGLVNVGGVSIFYFVAIYVTRALVGLAIGRLILRVVFNRNDVDERRALQYLALAIGVLLIAAAISLPIIGIIVNALALFLGLGAILIVVLAQFERSGNVSPTATPAWYSPSPAVIREHRLRADTPQATTVAQSMALASTQSVTMPGMPPAETQDKQPPPGTENLPEGFDWRFFDD